MLKPLRCLVVDDEPLAVEVIENYLHRLDNIDVMRRENAVEAFQLLQQEKFDVVFLDIEMPVLNGLDFLRSIKDAPAIIITTAYRHYAVESFEFEVLDYLLKPVSFPRFMKSFERALKFRQGIKEVDKSAPAKEDDYLFLKAERKFIKVLVRDILYIESLKDYIKVKTKTQTLVSYQSLTAITEKLPADKFMRIHRSFTVGIDKVNSIDGNCVEIEGELIPISRENRQEVLKRICK